MQTDKIRHTFHIHEPVLEKLRDVVLYIQKHKDEFSAEDLDLVDNLSRFTETAVMEKIMALEEKRGKEFPTRRKGQEVHFGRPPVAAERPNP